MKSTAPTMELVGIDGAVVFWTLGQQTDRDKVERGFRLIGPEFAGLAPQRRAPMQCLKDALGVVFDGLKVESLAKREGFAVLRTKPGYDDVEMETIHAFAVDKNGGLGQRREIGR